MLVHVKTLSLWEIAHYWHDLDPRKSMTHQLPLKVRDTLSAAIPILRNDVFRKLDKQRDDKKLYG